MLEKSSVRDDPGAFLSGPTLFAAPASTGGTTGVPLQLTRSLRSIVMEQACIDQLMWRLRADARDARIAVLRGDNVKDPSDLRPPFWTPAIGGRRLLFSSNHLSAATIEAYARAIEEFRPNVLWAYPTSLEALCLLLVRAGREAVGAACADFVRNARAAHLAARTRSAGRRAARLLRASGARRVRIRAAAGEYRFVPGYAHVELHPTAQEGEHVLYEIVGTNLWNHAMPLPRYRTGDSSGCRPSWGARELEEVALGLRTFHRRARPRQRHSDLRPTA